MVTCLRLVCWSVFLTGPLLAAEPAASPVRPNVLVIMADDMGYSDPGCYGGEISTPNLDGLAREGLRFTQFYNTARCWPSRAALLTGYYAQQVRRDEVPGVKSGAGGARPPWARLLPALLKSAGYRSYHSGKWHVDGKPMQEGFDHSYSLEDHDRHFAPRRHTLDDVLLPAVEPGSEYYSSTEIASHAIRWLQDHAANHAGEPFFEFLCFTAPHFPIQAPEEDIARCRGRYAAGWDALRAARWQNMQKLGIGGSALAPMERDVGPPYAFPQAIAKLGPDEVSRPLEWTALSESQRTFQARKMEIHAAMVERMDREIGRVLEQVRTMGAMENTLILFVSDNGASAEMMVRGDGHDPAAAPGSAATFLSIGPGWSSLANTPFRRHKTWVHEGGIATAFLAHWPRGISARGELRHTPAHLIDIVPTILELAGIRHPATSPDLPGMSLTPLFTKDGTVAHPFLWWLHEGNRALRSGQWKIVSVRDGPWELYDLSRDRSESRNLASEMPAKVQELAAIWQRQTTACTAQAGGR